MKLVKCQKCGEMYSESYKTCPFCQEDEARRAAPRQKNPPKHPSILGPVMVLVIIVVLGLLAFTIFGGRDDVTTPDDPDEPTVPVIVVLDRSVLNLTEGNSAQLRFSGVESVQWTSSDEAVATVDENGLVTAVAAGTTTVTATAENATPAACTVTVTAQEPEPEPEPTPEPTEKLVLQSIYGTTGDISLNVGGTAPMEVLGTDETVTWTMEDTSIATVDSDGTVHGVSKGNTILKATVAGQTLTCIIRVN